MNFIAMIQYGDTDVSIGLGLTKDEALDNAFKVHAEHNPDDSRPRDYASVFALTDGNRANCSDENDISIEQRPQP